MSTHRGWYARVAATVACAATVWAQVPQNSVAIDRDTVRIFDGTKNGDPGIKPVVGLIGLWRLDEKDGLLAEDSVGRSPGSLFGFREAGRRDSHTGPADYEDERLPGAAT